MRVHVYELLMAMQKSRRDFLKGTAGAAATLAASLNARSVGMPTVKFSV